jgi:hypothetical protein
MANGAKLADELTRCSGAKRPRCKCAIKLYLYSYIAGIGEESSSDEIACDYADSEVPAIIGRRANNSAAAKGVAPGNFVKVLIAEFNGLVKNVFHCLLPISGYEHTFGRCPGAARNSPGYAN